MKTTLPRILLIILAALLAVAMAGCKSESSPTAPPNTSTVPPGGGVTPPSGASITLTVSNATPLVSSSVVVTATVTSGGSNVPDGTAVQFTTTGGTFTDTGTTTTIRTTTGGVAKATLTSSAAATDTITATVNNASKSIQVTFSTAPVTPPPPNTTPTISSICVVTGTTCTTPATGLPAGGQQVIITGTNFRQPVRVLFDPGNGVPAKEAFVSAVTPTQITVTTPPFDITTGQTLPVTITVIDEAGTTSEQKVSQANAFTYQLAILTPVIRTLSPTSGPIDGGTRVSIIGDGFQAPVQVFFGSAEALVLKITFNEIDVMSPTARDTSPGGSGAVTGPIDVKVRNVGSGKEVTSPAAFRYVAKMQITAFGPGVGTAFGGTRVTIDGVGFVDPVTVSIGGAVAQPISVSGTEIVAITSRTPVPCSPPTGPVVVSNVDNGDSASTTVAFAFLAEKPLITNFGPNPLTEGSTLQATVVKPGVGLDGTAFIRFIVTADKAYTVFPTPGQISDPVGPVVFSLVTPTVPDSAFPTQVCTTGGGLAGTKKLPLAATLQFLNVTTTCTDTVSNLQILPTDTSCVANPTPPTPPPPAASVSPTTFCPNGFGSVAVSSTNPQVLTIRNTAAAGAQTLAVTMTITGADASQFTVSPASASVPPGGIQSVTVTFAPTSAGVKNATLVLVTNDPNQPTINVCLQGTGM